MKYVLFWATVQGGVAWKPFDDMPADKASMLANLKTLQQQGPYLLWWRIFREDTQGVFDEITAKGVSGGGVDC